MTAGFFGAEARVGANREFVKLGFGVGFFAEETYGAYENQTDRRRHSKLFITFHRSGAMLMELPQGKHQNH
jgi:hypothetical protein